MNKSNVEGISESLIENIIYYEQLKEQLTCNICYNLLNEPLMCSSCEVPFCKLCINSWTLNNTTCPSRCSSNSYVDIPRLFKQILEGLKLKCKYGCTVSLLNYSQHKSLCELKNKEVVCWNCQKVTLKQSELLLKEEDYKNLIKKNEEVIIIEKNIKEKNEERINKLELENNRLSNRVIELENELKNLNLSAKSNKKLDLDLAGSYKDRYLLTFFILAF